MVGRPILIVDALNLFSRHYVRNPAMSTQGHQAGGIVGFLNALANLNTLACPEEIYVVWEGGGSPRRRAIFKDYKAHRRPPRLNRYYEDIPDTNGNRMHQIRFLVEILKHVPVKQLFIDGCEADDVIGYMCRNPLRARWKIIASSDRDYYQLLDQTTIVYSWTSREFIGAKRVRERFNIDPCNFVLAKAICGDPSDNVPGVKGVGFKTLAKKFDLMSKQRSIPEIIDECIAAEHKLKMHEQIIENVDVIKRNWRLMYLDVANLAATQVRKIDAVIESSGPAKNKMQLMRSLLDEGLGAFDVHEFFGSFSAIH